MVLFRQRDGRNKKKEERGRAEANHQGGLANKNRQKWSCGLLVTFLVLHHDILQSENLDLKCISKQKEEYKQTNHIQIIYLDETDFVNFLDSTTVYLPFGIL